MKTESPYTIARRKMESAHTPAQRLAALREYQSATGEDWRMARAYMPKARALRFDKNRQCWRAHVAKPSARYVCVSASALEGLRDAGFSDQILSLRHQGWYADAYYDETYRGQVWRLPASDGREHFICGYVEENSGCAILDTDGAGRIWIGDDLREAARYANSLAGRMAETAREDSEKAQRAYQAQESADEAVETIKTARLRHSYFIRTAARETDATGRMIARSAAESAREQARAAVATIRQARETMDELKDYL